jgi:hypothetical protein
MNTLSLDVFLTGTRDFEAKQYEVLQGLKTLRAELRHNRLYPALAELVDLISVLGDFLQKKGEIQSRLPHRLKKLDLENKRLVYEPEKRDDADLERSVDLIHWAFPVIKNAIDEGTELYNFVEEHVRIEHVGIVPMYREEGYWFVPENTVSRLHLLRYEITLFTSTTERFRALKTRVLDSFEQASIRHSPESIKLDLIERYPDMPNPATYACETDLDFPYNETILPVAKRKLMEQVFS